MSCYSELTYSVYADGELSREEATAVERHLETCAGCRRLVAALRNETLMLREALADPERDAAEAPAWSPAGRHNPGGALLAVIAALAGLRVTLGFLFDLQAPTGLDSALDWLNPFHLNTQLEMLFRSVFFVAEEGASMVVFMVSVVSVLILLVLGVFASLLVRRHGAQISAGLLASLAVFGSVLGAPTQAAAVEIRHVRGRLETITIPAGTTINDSLIAAADTVNVDGVINGNLIAAGRHIVVRGTVQGDLIAAAQEVDVEGTVTGNVFTFAQWNNVRGKIQGTVYAFSQAFRFDAGGAAAGDLIAFGASAQVEGSVVRDAMVFGSVTDVRGKIGRNLSVAGDRVVLAAGSTVGGDFLAKVPAQMVVTVDPGAKISGKQDIEIVTRRSFGWNRFSDPRFYFWQCVQLVGALIFGAFLLVLFPGFYKSTAAEVGNWMRSLGLGFAVLFATPVAIVLAAVTLIGLPVAFATLFLYIAGMYMAKIFAGAWLGQTMLRRPEHNNGDTLLALLVGMVIIFIAVQVPYVGPIFHLVLFCLGLGVFTWKLYSGVRATA